MGLIFVFEFPYDKDKAAIFPGINFHLRLVNKKKKNLCWVKYFEQIVQMIDLLEKKN